ncbi:hypothetical protein F7734_28785 [Scytonema sp. UIC 10036]|uniref:hypothetical protein n=1 Tax=Scytonema sp. UIC 10036 TaxID=2304196 RepID=UPI0012DA0530|nr:hypothetical protein [Scytonema sp. UIC 10036]MUG96121.1 hypothetical protein [Scytonema sp. UIC 10036]
MGGRASSNAFCAKGWEREDEKVSTEGSDPLFFKNEFLVSADEITTDAPPLK